MLPPRNSRLPALQVERRAADIGKKLLAARQQRRRPARDDKILTAWNGLMIRTLAKAGVIFQKPEYVQAAEKAAEFILTEMRDEQGRLYHSYAAKQAKLNAYLDDYAYVNEGLLALHLATNDEKWANAAQRLGDMQLADVLGRRRQWLLLHLARARSASGAHEECLRFGVTFGEQRHRPQPVASGVVQQASRVTAIGRGRRSSCSCR